MTMMSRPARCTRAGALLLLLAAGRVAAGQPARPVMAAPPRRSVRLGFDSDRLTRIDSLLQRAADRSEIGGAVALVLKDGQTVYERAFGWADREASRRMTTDAIF